MLIEFIVNQVVPYTLLMLFILFAIVSVLIWTPLGGEWAKMDIRKQYKMRFFKQTYAIAVMSPFIVFFLNRQGMDVPFSDFKLLNWIETSTNYFEKNNSGLDRTAFDIFDMIFLWSWRFLQYFMPPFFLIALYRSRDSVIEKLLAGDVKRGVQFIESNEKYIKLVTEAAKTMASRLEKNLGFKLPSFYTARVFFGKFKIPFFIDSETKSIIYLGGAGSGKSVAIWEYIVPLINWSKHNHQFTWIVYDMKHDFYTKMYRPDKDVLFFPKHKSTAIWNMFREFNQITIDEYGNKTWEIEMGKLIQFVSYWMPTKEDSSAVWIEKAQKAAVAVLITVSKTFPNPSMKDFIDFTMQYNTKDKMVEKIIELGYAQTYGYNISAIFGETEAGSNVYEIFEQATTELRKLDFYFSDEEANFSIAEFNEPLTKLTKKDIKTLSPKERNMDKRLFLIQDQENVEYYSTAFRIILELQAKKLLSFEQDLDRRVFFLLDEAASLGKMTCIFDEIPEKGRSKGGALIIGLQTLAKFKSIYTEDLMNSILANIKTKVFMAIEDPYTQKWIKESLDTVESERNSLSANEQDGGSVSYSLESRDTLKSTEISGIAINTGYLRMGLYLTKVEFSIQKLKDNISFEANKNIPARFKTEFGQEEEVNLNQRREEVINAIIELKTKTNKQITPQNVNFIVKKSLESVASTLNCIKEEQEQILITMKEQLIVEGYTFNELSIKELSERTGLANNVIEINYSLIKLEETKLIERVRKFIEKIDSTGLSFKTENDKIKKLIELSGEKEFLIREAYQKIISNKFYPNELPYEVFVQKKKIKPSDKDANEETIVPETLNGPDEDFVEIKKNSQEDEEAKKKRIEERAKRIEARRLEQIKKEEEIALKKELAVANKQDKEEQDLVDLSFFEEYNAQTELEIEMPEDELVVDETPYNNHPHMN